MKIKDILVWWMQRHAEKEWSHGEGTRLHLQKAELIRCSVEYYIYHVASDPETSENRRSLYMQQERI